MNQWKGHEVKNKKNTIQKKQFSEIIPSPVKAIINSPFKCPVSFFLVTNNKMIKT